MRRVAALSALVLSTALVAGCSGGPKALSYDEAKDTLLSEDAFPLDGFTRTINDDQGTESQDDQPMTDIVGVFQGVPSGCTDAARAVDDGDTFADYDETDSPSASSARATSTRSCASRRSRRTTRTASRPSRRWPRSAASSRAARRACRSPSRRSTRTTPRAWSWC